MSINAIYSTITYYPSIWSLFGGAICAAAAAEIAYRLFKDMQDKPPPNLFRQELGRAALFTLCATNLVPYTAFLGGLVFYLHSWTGILNRSQKLSKMYTLSQFLVVSTVTVAEALWPYCLSLAERAYLFLSSSPSIISLKEKEVWKAVALLIAAIFITKGFLWMPSTFFKAIPPIGL